MKYVVDTSVLVEKLVTQYIKDKKITDTVVVPRVVIAELENQANTGRDIGFIGLEEIQELQELSKKKKIKLEIVGDRPSIADIKGAKRGGMIDSMIIDFAVELKATLVTADMVQAESAKALGMQVLFVEKDFKEGLSIEQYFDDTTMSIHMKAGTFVYAKKGKPGQWKLEQVSKERLSEKEVEVYAKGRDEFKKIIDPLKLNDHDKNLNSIQHQFDWSYVAAASNALCIYFGNTTPKRLYSFELAGYMMPSDEVIYVIMPCRL